MGGNVDFILSSIMGGDAYDELFGENQPTGSIQDMINQLSPEQRAELEAEGSL